MTNRCVDDPDYLALIGDNRDKLLRVPPKCRRTQRDESSKVAIMHLEQEP